jgi:hypothetical protein
MCRKRVGEVRRWRGAAALGVGVVAQRVVDG